nr:reverse transcriptase domain-containing protein [Tanacetum cinerariifolium]
MDHFTKWIEVRPVATITGAQVKKFVWDNIVCRFGLLREIISDNGKQFRDNPFKDWCEKLILKVGMPISAGITASAPYVNENGISSLLDLIMASVYPFYQAVGLGMFNGGESLADT